MNEQRTSEADPAAGGEPKVIKRYTNRKLYDTVESRYVTLDEIAEMIKAGAEVKIVDNRTKRDLALFLREPEGLAVLPRLVARALVFVRNTPLDSRQRRGHGGTLIQTNPT